MATKKQVNSPLDDSQEPDWPTQKKKLDSEGRAIGIDNSVWMYRRVAMGPVDTAKTNAAAIAQAQSIIRALTELANATRVRAPRRSMAKGKYRDIHILLVNIPEQYDPSGQPLGEHLARQFPYKEVKRRILMIGTRLQPSLRGGGWKQAVESVADTFSPEAMDVNMAEYARDSAVVDAAFTRANLKMPTPEEFRIVDSWWNAGRFPDTPYLVHNDHLHMFTATDSLAEAARLQREGVDCTEAPWQRLSRHHTLSMVAFDKFDQEYTAVESPDALWVSELLQLGASAVSIRGKLEPGHLTRNQLRAGRKAFLNDIMDAEREGTTMDRADQQDKLTALEHMEAAYATNQAPPSLIETSVLAAISGSDEHGTYDVSAIGRRLKLSNMAMRQEKALAEMMMCSQVRSNPNLKDLPVTAIAYSGLPSLSVVGDRTGALLGFTEHDDQPAYVSSTAASAGDSSPLMLVAGQTGSGKTQVLLWLASQWAQSTKEFPHGVPQIIVDPKMDSDHTATVEGAGGRVMSLDELSRADGVLDPLRFAASGQAGVDMAASILLQVDPWGGRGQEWEADLTVALGYGVEHGATCIGQALQIALDGEMAAKEMVEPVLRLTNQSPFFRACVGTDPDVKGLRVSNGITLIKAGATNLDLPTPGQPPKSLQQRVSVALVRMMVYGSAMALTGRKGVLHFDEAWVAMAGGAEEVQRLGRLARSQGVLPILYTQRVSDAVNNELVGYISRGIILAISDREEAEAACRLFGLEPTEDRLARIMAKDREGGDADNAEGVLNYNSLRALFEYDPTKPEGRGRNIRGSVGIYVDLRGRAVPVVIQLPTEFFELSSTNPLDIERREKRLKAQRLQQAKERLTSNDVVDGSDIELDKAPAMAGATPSAVATADAVAPAATRPATRSAAPPATTAPVESAEDLADRTSSWMD